MPTRKVYNNTSQTLVIGGKTYLASGGSTNYYAAEGTSVSFYCSPRRYITSGGATSTSYTWSGTSAVYIYEYSKFTYSTDGNGSITCSIASGAYLRANYQGYTLTANPNSGYSFNKWSGSSSSTSRTISGTIGYDDLSFKANFTKNPTYYTVTASSNNTNWGTVNPTTQSVYEGLDSKEILATPKDLVVYGVRGYYLDGTFYSGDIRKLTLTSVRANHTVQFVFYIKQTFTVTVSADSHGTTTPSGDISVEYDGSLTMEAKSTDDNYKFNQWVAVYGGQTHTFTSNPMTTRNVVTNEQWHATFRQYKFGMTMNHTGVGSVKAIVEGYTRSSEGYAYPTEEGVDITLIAEVGAHYRFVEWLKNGIRISTNTTFTTEMPSDDVVYTAVFVEKTKHSLQVTCDKKSPTGVTIFGGYVEVDGSRYTPGTTIYFYEGEGFILRWQGSYGANFTHWIHHQEGGDVYYDENPRGFDFTHDVTLSYMWYWIPMYEIAQMTPSRAGYVTLVTAETKAKSTTTQPAALYWKWEEYPDTPLKVYPTITGSHELYQFQYWEIYDRNLKTTRTSTELPLVFSTEADYSSYSISCIVAVTYKYKASSTDFTKGTASLILEDGTIVHEFDYYPGETVTLKATAIDGNEFVYWSIDNMTDTSGLDLTNPNLTFIVDEKTKPSGLGSDVDIKAHFKTVATEVSIKTKVSPTDAGYITINDVQKYSAVVEVGSTVVLEAFAHDDYEFINWSDGDTNSRKSFTATTDVDLTANFQRNDDSDLILALFILAEVGKAYISCKTHMPIIRKKTG